MSYDVCLAEERRAANAREERFSTQRVSRFACSWPVPSMTWRAGRGGADRARRPPPARREQSEYSSKESETRPMHTGGSWQAMRAAGRFTSPLLTLSPSHSCFPPLPASLPLLHSSCSLAGRPPPSVLVLVPHLLRSSPCQVHPPCQAELLREPSSRIACREQRTGGKRAEGYGDLRRQQARHLFSS